MSSARVEIEVEAGRAESAALLEALLPETKYERSPFTVSLIPRGLLLTVSEGTLPDTRAFTNSILRLLKAASECIQAVD